MSYLSIGQLFTESKNNKRNVFVIYFVNTYNPCGSGIIPGEGTATLKIEFFISIFPRTAVPSRARSILYSNRSIDGARRLFPQLGCVDDPAFWSPFPGGS